MEHEDKEEVPLDIGPMRRLSKLLGIGNSRAKMAPKQLEKAETRIFNRRSTIEQEISGINDEIPRGSQLIKSSLFSIRMSQRKTRKCLMCYPEDKLKSHWEGLVSFSLLIMCITTPIYIAFHDDSVPVQSGSFDWDFFNAILDILFAIDIFVVFCSAYYNDDF